MLLVEADDSEELALSIEFFEVFVCGFNVVGLIFEVLLEKKQFISLIFIDFCIIRAHSSHRNGWTEHRLCHELTSRALAHSLDVRLHEQR